MNRVDPKTGQEVRASETPTRKPLVFLAEQKGEVEAAVTALWTQLFQTRHDVAAAWLVNAYDPNVSARRVALCLRAARDQRQGLVHGILQHFQTMFHPEETLVILFLDDKQTEQVQAVAHPFYLLAGEETSPYGAAAGLPFSHANVPAALPKTSGERMSGSTVRHSA